jgi:hypothetical protein
MSVSAKSVLKLPLVAGLALAAPRDPLEPAGRTRSPSFELNPTWGRGSRIVSDCASVANALQTCDAEGPSLALCGTTLEVIVTVEATGLASNYPWSVRNLDREKRDRWHGTRICG